jgi:presenilin-like A22 family membrane protease
MDIKNPTINLQGNESESNASKSTPKSIVLGLIIGFLMGLLVIMYSGGGNPLTAYLILIVASVIFAIYRLWMLILRINLCYEKIEM